MFAGVRFSDGTNYTHNRTTLGPGRRAPTEALYFLHTVKGLYDCERKVFAMLELHTILATNGPHIAIGSSGHQLLKVARALMRP
jgi:hypothetical protein